jgi:hypothetical protein
MNKKAQFYILTALILILIAFGLVQSTKTVQQAKSTFTETTENLARESAIAINQAIYSQEDTDTAYLKFFRNFMTYSRTKDTQFKALYALKQGKTIIIQNEIGETVTIKEKGAELENSANTTITAQPTITITYKNSQYPLKFNGNDIELRILATTENANEKRIKTLEVG